MMKKASIIFIFVMSILTQSNSFGHDATIAHVNAEFKTVQPPTVLNSVEQYLSRFLHKKATPELLAISKEFIERLYFINKADCKYVGHEEIVELKCDIYPKKHIKKINIKNLPNSLLETELRRKLPIQVGHLIDSDNETSNDDVGITKLRVQTFLKTNGFYGAVVDVREVGKENSSDVEFDIEISHGVNVKVNEVFVEGDSPISKEIIKNMYEKMCLSFSRFFDGLTLGTMRCYSRNLEKETTKELQNRLAKMGYVQSYVRVSLIWVDPEDKQARSFCRTKNKESCVNLRVDIEKGPLVRWSINMKDNVGVNIGALTAFLSTLFASEPIYRATASRNSEDFALDSAVNLSEIENRITFIAAHNIDEIEIRESSNQIVQYLVSRGYINARVVPSLVQKKQGEVNVDLDIYTGDNHFLNTVQIEPARFREFISPDAVKKILPLRSVLNSGHVSYRDFEAALAEIKDQLLAKGFSNIEVKADLQTDIKGAINAVLYVVEERGEQKIRDTIDEVLIINGVKSIDEEALKALRNCDNYNVSRGKISAKLCAESSLIKDAIVTDASKLEDFYHNNGYLYAKVRADLNQNSQGYQLVFHVYDERFAEDDHKTLNKQKLKGLIVSGNDRTRTSVIKRLFPAEHRDLDLDPNSLKKGITNLRASGRFSKIDHKIVAAEPNSDDVYYSIQFAENPSLFVNTALSFSTDQLFAAELEVKEANFLKSMLNLEASLGLGFFWGRQSNLSNKIIWPLIFGKPLRLSIEAPKIVYDDRTHLETPYRRLQTKLGATLDWQATASLTPYLRFSLLHTQKDINARKQPFFSEQLKTIDGLISTAKLAGDLRGIITPGFSYVKVDNPFNPRFGALVDNWVEFSGLPFMGKPPFTNLVTNNRFFLPFGSAILAFRLNFVRSFVEFGHENWDRLGDVSSMHNLGGDRSIRGYADEGIKPSSATSSEATLPGYLLNTASMELRFPLSTSSELTNFWGAVFVDEGMIARCTSLFDCNLSKSAGDSIYPNLGFSLGVGLRYILPVGPISLDYAISPIHRNTMRLHLLFGYSF